MPRLTSFPRLAAVFITLLLLAPWSAQARPLEGSDPLGSAVAGFTAWITALFGDYGCIMDPSGACRGAGSTAADQIDIGCSLDPDGQCRESSAADQIDIGCSADPNGGACGNHG